MKKIGKQKIVGISGLAVNRKGRVLVAESGNDRLKEFEGLPSEQTAGGFNRVARKTERDTVNLRSHFYVI
jgi:hypothetical protein